MSDFQTEVEKTTGYGNTSIVLKGKIKDLADRLGVETLENTPLEVIDAINANTNVVDTTIDSDGASESDILLGKKAIVNGQEVVGTFESGGGSSGFETAILNGSISGEYTNTELTTLRDSAFWGCKMSTLNLPNVTSIKSNAFRECTNLQALYLPNLGQTGYYNSKNDTDYMCYGCTSLESVNLPNWTPATSSVSSSSKYQGYLFYGCTSLKKAYLPKVVGLSHGVTSLDSGLVSQNGILKSCFYDCPSLEEVYFENVGGLIRGMFGGTTANNFSLECDNYFYPVFYTTSVPTDTTDYPFPSGFENNGYIFVPFSTINEFLANALWTIYIPRFGFKANLTANTTKTQIAERVLLGSFELYPTKADLKAGTNALEQITTDGEYWLWNVQVGYVGHDVTGTTTLSTSIACEIGDMLLACVLARSAFTAPDGWELVDTAPEIAGTTTTQTMYVYKKVATSTNETFVSTVATAARIYCCLVNVKDKTNIVSVPSMKQSTTDGSLTFTKGDNNLLVFTEIITANTSYHSFSATGDYSVFADFGNATRLGFAYSSMASGTSFTIQRDSRLSSQWATLGIEIS